MMKPIRFLKVVAHASALVFGAFWIVATSAPTGPAEDCFTGIRNPTKLAVVVGGPAAQSSGLPSCAGIDGVAEGATLVFSLTQGPRPQDVVVSTCWDYQTDAIEGLAGVDLLPGAPGGAHTTALTIARGSISSSQWGDCMGSWTLVLSPPVTGGTDEPISPLDPSKQWSIHRTIGVSGIGMTESCADVFPGEGGCSDSFPVVSITEVAP